VSDERTFVEILEAVEQRERWIKQSVETGTAVSRTRPAVANASRTSAGRRRPAGVR
jgi:hypothetical protein